MNWLGVLMQYVAGTMSLCLVFVVVGVIAYAITGDSEDAFDVVLSVFGWAVTMSVLVVGVWVTGRLGAVLFVLAGLTP